MSTHAGWYLSTSPWPREKVATLADSLRWHGPDEVVMRVDGPVGMIYGAFTTVADPAPCGQPHELPSGHWLTFDGRLDDRDTLAALCTARGPLGDAALCGELFAERGPDALRQMIGDWAVAIAHPRQPIVVLARDYSGSRPLYYAAADRGIIWSSELETVRLARDGATTLDRAYLAEFLAGPPDVGRTPYAEVKAVRPGHVVTWQAGRLVDTVLWDARPTHHITYRRDADYAEHFRELFIRAVLARLRTPRTPWIELSGGLDSSSIVCVASRLTRARAVPAPTITPVSYQFDQATSADERVFQRHVEQAIGLSARRLVESSFTLFELPADRPPPLMPQTVAGRTVQVARLMEENEARVLLSGHGGDAVMRSSDGYYPVLADHFRDRAFLKFGRQVSALSRVHGVPLWQTAMHHLRCASMASHQRRALHASPWMRADGLHGLLEARDEALAAETSAMRPSDRASVEGIHSSVGTIAQQHFRSCGRVEATYPYLDRRLVEFMLAIPYEQKVRPGEPRLLHRAALAGILPEAIRQRRTKARGAEFIGTALKREWAFVTRLAGSDMRLSALGLIEPHAFRLALDHVRQSLSDDVFHLIRALALEVWLQSRERLSSICPAQAGANVAQSVVG